MANGIAGDPELSGEREASGSGMLRYGIRDGCMLQRGEGRPDDSVSTRMALRTKSSA